MPTTRTKTLTNRPTGLIISIRHCCLALCLLLVHAIGTDAQQLHSYRNLAEGGYHFWFYSPEKPQLRPVPIRPEDPDLQWRMYLEELYHPAEPTKWWRTKEDQEAERASRLKPLVLFLHGQSLCGRDIRKVLQYGTLEAMDYGLEVDAFVLAPQNPGGAWKPDRLMDLVEWASRTHPNIDTTRVYVLGMSLGGYGTLDLAAAYPHRIAAAMAICGGATTKDIANLRQVPLWILHGTLDTAVPISCSDRVVAAMKRGAKPERLIYSRLKGYDHGRPARLFYMPHTYEWLFAHRTTDENRPLNKDISIGTHNIPTAYRNLRSRGHLPSSDSREVHAHGHLEHLEFTLMQDSIARADSIMRADSIRALKSRAHGKR